MPEKKKCRLCGWPDIYKDGLCSQCWEGEQMSEEVTEGNVTYWGGRPKGMRSTKS